MEYAILLHPGHNRVYFETSKTLSVSELALAGESLSSPCQQVQVEEIASVPYVTFQTAKPLQESDFLLLGQLSFVYALFEQVKTDKETCLRPIACPSLGYLPESIRTILKYTGKTNELFTRMMIQVARAACTSQTKGAPLRLLDPVAGKGTTLSEGLLCGMHSFGVEINADTVHEAYQFMKKYLETAKQKHETHVERISGQNRSFTAKRYTIDFAPDKESMKTAPLHWELVAGNSIHCDQLFKKNTFDLLVGDLPYGVQHGSKTTSKNNKRPSSITRNPSELIASCAPAWRKVLKPGGVLALAYNQFLLSFEEFAALLEEAGFTVLKEEKYRQFTHRVDQAILRDIILAK